MLKKLLKYDLIWIYKFLVIFYAIALFFSLLTRIFFSIGNSFAMDFLAQFCSGVAISMFISSIINNLTRLWLRFKQNFYGDESYLTHTLPIKKSTLYVSKALTAVISLFTSVLVIVACLFIAYYSKENMEILKKTLFSFSSAMDSSVFGFLFALVVLLFLEFLTALQAGYLGTIIGHTKNGPKTGLSVLFGFCVYMLVQVFGVLTVVIAGLFYPSVLDAFITNDVSNITVFKTVLWICMFAYTIAVAVMYWISLKLFKRGVNVD